MAGQQDKDRVLPPPNRKVYDGSLVVAHTIQEGQSLALISDIYQFKRWEPIWIYNTKIEKTIGDDPNAIRKGVTIFIPRNQKGYETVINKMQALSSMLEGDADVILARMEGEWYDLEAYKVVINTAGDIFKTVAMLGFKAVEAAKAANAAKAAIEQARIAAHHSMRTSSRAVAGDLAALASKRVATAKSLSAASKTAKGELGKEIRNAAYGAAAKAGDAAVGRLTGKPSEDMDKIYKARSNAQKADDIVRNFEKMRNGARALLDVTEIVLDYVEPAMLADTYVMLSSGERTETTYDQQRQHVRKTAEAGVERLSGQIEALKAECKMLYG